MKITSHTGNGTIVNGTHNFETSMEWFVFHALQQQNRKQRQKTIRLRLRSQGMEKQLSTDQGVCEWILFQLEFGKCEHII